MKNEKDFDSLQPLEYASLLTLASSAVILIGLQLESAGWPLLIIGLILTWFTSVHFRNNILLLYGSLAILGLVPITTDTSNENFARMGIALTAAIALPYIISKYIYKENAVAFRFHHGRRWFRSEILYIGLTAVIAYLVLPFYLRSSGAYLNWGVEPTTEGMIRLFIGTNALGIWDELFFVSTVLGILRLYLPFKFANILQAILFTSFLHDLGFTGWAPLLIFPFALLQGYVFKKTDSLLYVITIHLTLDFILFLALINAHHPHLVDIFIT